MNEYIIQYKCQYYFIHLYEGMKNSKIIKIKNIKKYNDHVSQVRATRYIII